MLYGFGYVETNESYAYRLNFEYYCANRYNKKNLKLKKRVDNK